MHACMDVCMAQSCAGHRVLGEGLLKAAQNGRADGIDAMLAADAAVDYQDRLCRGLPAVDYQDRLWRTPLHLACMHGHTECVTTLLTAGADRDKQDHSGQTPIYFAAAFGHSACVEALLAANAALDIPRWDGYTPLHLAVSFSCSACTDAVLHSGPVVFRSVQRGWKICPQACCSWRFDWKNDPSVNV